MAPPNGTGPIRRRSTGGSMPAGRARPRPTAPVDAESQLATLSCLAGPAKGAEYVLEGDELVIGRAADAAISIADTSVSRRHVQLNKTEEGWAASDMGSGNGTMVNGSTIAEQTLLHDGDVISMGDTDLKFSDASAPKRSTAIAVPSAPRPSALARPSGARPAVRSSRRMATVSEAEVKAQRSKLFVRIGAAVIVLAAAGIGFKVWRDKREVIEAQARLEAQKLDEQLRGLTQEGKNLVRQGKWGEAKAKFEEVLATNPSYGNGVDEYIKRCDKEIPNELKLNEASDAVDAGKIGAAHLALQAVTTDTLQGTRRDQIQAALDKKLESALLEGRALLAFTTDRAKMEQLKALADDVLVAKADHRDALELKKIAEGAIDRIDRPVIPAPEPKRPWLQVQALFAGGDQTGAFALAQKCEPGFAQCKQLSAQIHDFGERFKKLESLSPNELAALLELDRKITGGPASPMARLIAVRANATLLKQASSARATGNWSRAAELAKKVLWSDPGSADATEILNEANSHVRDLYMRAYSIKETDPDEAQRLFKQVIEMTSPDNEFHGKAKRWLSGHSGD